MIVISAVMYLQSTACNEIHYNTIRILEVEGLSRFIGGFILLWVFNLGECNSYVLP